MWGEGLSEGTIKRNEGLSRWEDECWHGTAGDSVLGGSCTELEWVGPKGEGDKLCFSFALRFFVLHIIINDNNNHNNKFYPSIIQQVCSKNVQ